MLSYEIGNIYTERVMYSKWYNGLNQTRLQVLMGWTLNIYTMVAPNILLLLLLNNGNYFWHVLVWRYSAHLKTSTINLTSLDTHHTYSMDFD